MKRTTGQCPYDLDGWCESNGWCNDRCRESEPRFKATRFSEALVIMVPDIFSFDRRLISSKSQTKKTVSTGAR